MGENLIFFFNECQKSMTSLACMIFFLVDAFSPGFPARQSPNALNHLVIGRMLALEGGCLCIINILLLGNLVQAIDPWVSTTQAFLEMHTGSHILIPRPMKFDPCLAQRFLHIKAAPSLLWASSSFATGRRRRNSSASLPLSLFSSRSHPIYI